MRFDALELSLGIIGNLRRILPAIRTRDPGLATQIRNAGSSVALNLAEGNRRRGRDRIHLWNVASGSAEELRVALRVAAAWGYLSEHRTTEANAKIDHLQAMLWKLTR